jgi:hypothetical protein
MQPKPTAWHARAGGYIHMTARKIICASSCAMVQIKNNHASRGLNNGAHRARHPGAGAGTARSIHRGVLLSRSPQRGKRNGSAVSGATARAALQGLRACCSCSAQRCCRSALPAAALIYHRGDSLLFSTEASASKAPLGAVAHFFDTPASAGYHRPSLRRGSPHSNDCIPNDCIQRRIIPDKESGICYLHHNPTRILMSGCTRGHCFSLRLYALDNKCRLDVRSIHIQCLFLFSLLSVVCTVYHIYT